MGKKRRQDVLESELDPDPESEDLSMLFPPSPILPTNDIQPVDNDHNDSLQQNHDLPLDNLEQTLLFQPSNSQEIVDNATFQHLDSFLQPTPSIPRIFIPTIPNVPSIRYMPKHLIPIPAAEIIRISDFQQSFQDLLKNTGYVGNNLQKMLVEKLGNDEFSKLEESCRIDLTKEFEESDLKRFIPARSTSDEKVQSLPPAKTIKPTPTISTSSTPSTSASSQQTAFDAIVNLKRDKANTTNNGSAASQQTTPNMLSPQELFTLNPHFQSKVPLLFQQEPDISFEDGEKTTTINEPSVIVRVRYHHPRNPYKVLLELDVLGSNTLAELREKLVCVLDYLNFEAVEEVAEDIDMENVDNRNSRRRRKSLTPLLTFGSATVTDFVNENTDISTTADEPSLAEALGLLSDDESHNPDESTQNTQSLADDSVDDLLNRLFEDTEPEVTRPRTLSGANEDDDFGFGLDFEWEMQREFSQMQRNSLFEMPSPGGQRHQHLQQHQQSPHRQHNTRMMSRDVMAYNGNVFMGTSESPAELNERLDFPTPAISPLPSLFGTTESPLQTSTSTDAFTQSTIATPPIVSSKPKPKSKKRKLAAPPIPHFITYHHKQLQQPASFKSHPKQEPRVKSPSYFYIQDTFYTDSPEAVRDVQVVIEWMKHVSPGKDVASVKDMNSTKISELSIRLNYPYLFAHHGTCQHIISFTSVELVEPSIEPRKSFPAITYMAKSNRLVCRFCKVKANYLVFHDVFAPQNPCAWCRQCFESFHYNRKGKLSYGGFERFDITGAMENI